MIPLACVQRVAEELMAKAAIEIPEDYLAGLRKCADTEKGDLSAFVIRAMLENYEAAKEDRRAMCGDTGLPRWYAPIVWRSPLAYQNAHTPSGRDCPSAST